MTLLAVTFVLVAIAVVLFGMAACSAPKNAGRFQPGWAGMLVLTVALWLIPLCIQVL